MKVKYLKFTKNILNKNFKNLVNISDIKELQI